jgi:hypothetical protein
LRDCRRRGSTVQRRRVKTQEKVNADLVPGRRGGSSHFDFDRESDRRLGFEALKALHPFVFAVAFEIQALLEAESAEVGTENHQKSADEEDNESDPEQRDKGEFGECASWLEHVDFEEENTAKVNELLEAGGQAADGLSSAPRDGHDLLKNDNTCERSREWTAEAKDDSYSEDTVPRTNNKGKGGRSKKE